MPPTFASNYVEIHASTGGAYAGFLLLQTGYFSNLLIATIQNEISMGLDYLLNMGEDINNYAYVPEYASPSVAFYVTYNNGSTAYFVPGAPAHSPPYFGIPVYGTPMHHGNFVSEVVPVSTSSCISDSLISETTNKVSVFYDAYTYVVYVGNTILGTVYLF